MNIPTDLFGELDPHELMKIFGPVKMPDKANTVKLFRQLTEAGHGEIAKEFNMRQIMAAEGYLSPVLMQASYVRHMLLQEMGGHFNSTDANITVGGSWLALHYWPTYFIGKDLVDALIQTTPPKDLTWEDLRWPIPAALFVLPDTKELQKYFLVPEHVPGIAVMKLKKPHNVAVNKLIEIMKKVKVINEAGAEEIMPERALVQMCYNDPGMGGTWHDLCCRPRWSLEESLSKTRYEAAPNLVDTTEEDMVRMSRATHLCINLLTYMASDRAHTVVEGSVIRKAGKKGSRPVPALWHPNWIGRDYVLHKPIHDGPKGTHASPRTHWRVGHWAHYRVGIGRTTIIIKWREPMLINAPKEDKPAIQPNE